MSVAEVPFLRESILFGTPINSVRFANKRNGQHSFKHCEQPTVIVFCAHVVEE